MNRITRERIKKQREAKSFTGIKIKDFSKMFKRKEMQAPTPSGVKPQTTKTKPEATKTKPEATVTKPKGRAEKMMENAAGNPNRPSSTVATPTKDKIKEQIASLKVKFKTASSRNRIAIQRKIDRLTKELK